MPAKIRLVFFVLCSNRGARKSLNHSKLSWRHCSHLAGVGRAGVGEGPFVRRRISRLSCTSSDPLGLAFLSCSPCCSGQLCTDPEEPHAGSHLTPVPCASCPGDTVSWAHRCAAQKCGVNPWGVASNRQMLPFLPRKDPSFPKAQTPHYRGQGPAYIASPSSSLPLPCPSLLLRGSQ